MRMCRRVLTSDGALAGAAEAGTVAAPRYLVLWRLSELPVACVWSAAAMEHVRNFCWNDSPGAAPPHSLMVPSSSESSVFLARARRAPGFGSSGSSSLYDMASYGARA